MVCPQMAHATTMALVQREKCEPAHNHCLWRQRIIALKLKGIARTDDETSASILARLHVAGVDNTIEMMYMPDGLRLHAIITAG